MTEAGNPTRTFGPGYLAKESTAICMEKVQSLLDATIGMTLVSDLTVTLTAVQAWAALAQVHATAALVGATEAQLLLQKTCRCIRD